MIGGLLCALLVAAASGRQLPFDWDVVRSSTNASNIHSSPLFTPAAITADPATVKKIEEGFEKLQAAAECKSLLKQCLTKEVVQKLKAKKTKLGATLWDVIQSGVANLDSGVGVYAPDAESYTLFAPLLDAVIQEYHGFKPTDTQPAMDLGESTPPPTPSLSRQLAELTDLDPEGKFVISTRVRCGRSLAGYPFNPLLTEANYKNMEARVKATLEGISDPELKGAYYPLTGMSADVQQKLIADHFLFKQGDRFLEAANANRFWPTGRGIFHNEKKTFLVWVNEEDHLRIISMQPGGNVGAVLGRLIKGLNAIGQKTPFARHARLGWLTFCPTNLGTTVRASVHVKLPKLSAKPDFKQICADLKLQPRGIHGEHSETEGGAVKVMHEGVKKLIELEKAEP
ncbi:Arginine kinase [Aphelenchoides fujianensis]|nr:Arginine kinase [Aphelenchoides fujianensis]